jgi:Protein of unknown function (DUF1566)
MKKMITFYIFALISLFLIAACSVPGKNNGSASNGTSSSSPSVKTYALGDTGPSGAGIVFYITNGGLNGLEAALLGWNGGSADPALAWITGGSTQTTLNGNTLTAIGTGLANSNAIIAQSGGTASAAQLCRNYLGGGKTDWFLPSKDELNQLYAQRNIVGGFSIISTYWNSSESSASLTWSQSFNNGGQATSDKSNPCSVRAIRAF